MIHHPQPLRRNTDDHGTSHRLMRPQVQGDPNMRSSASGTSGVRENFGDREIVGREHMKLRLSSLSPETS